MFTKFLSRKFLTSIGVALIDIFISNGILPFEMKDLLIKAITSIGGAYIAIEGIIDIWKKERPI